ncbi:MAG: hypothetical protein J7500_10345 [Sphingomonas sp.]|uniref:hypothetical protein n=1 Tax=Sphingomonas sp. TaxID=28214 RepID=UPI001B00B4B0|nr:hypothetical protein [Sphingomonas sp.]MBO9623098.1 hypothetical protein [Sphingomonas sp.]
MTADRRWWWLLAAILLLGFALRLAGAQGGLWLDEAWSAVQARDAGTPIGVFLNINHDNNHHLNSLWMQLVGFGAPSPLVRGLSIATGTASIWVAWLIGARRGLGVAAVTAALFAVSPAMVTMGSEARGYAPMMLALLVAILLVDRRLDGAAERSPATALALCFFLGALAQLTILFGFFAVAGWAFFTLWKREGLRSALVETLKLFAPSIVAIGLVFAILAAGAMHGNGFHFGNYDPFTWVQFVRGVSVLVQYTLGFPIVTVWWIALVPALVILAPGMGVTRIAFHRLAILAFPLVLALLHSGNVAHPRYYLLVGVALLILLGELLWHGLAAGGWRRWAAGGALAAIVAASLFHDMDLATNRRGDTSAAIRAMQARAPHGARVLIDRDTALAALEVGSAQAHYRLEIRKDACVPAQFLLADRFQGEEPPPTADRCGQHYRPIESMRAHGLSGTHWTLYEHAP